MRTLLTVSVLATFCFLSLTESRVFVLWEVIQMGAGTRKKTIGGFCELKPRGMCEKTEGRHEINVIVGSHFVFIFT